MIEICTRIHTAAVVLENTTFLPRAALADKCIALTTTLCPDTVILLLHSAFVVSSPKKATIIILKTGAGRKCQSRKSRKMLLPCIYGYYSGFKRPARDNLSLLCYLLVEAPLGRLQYNAAHE